jgi:hypothetical protein
MKKTITVLLAILSMFGSSTVFAQDQGGFQIHNVTGSLRDADGVAMTGARVVFRPIDNPFLNYVHDVSSYVYATVDEQGNYSVDLLEGDYGVSFGVRSNSSNYPFYAGALPVRPDACDGTYDAREGVASYWFGGTCKYGDFYNDAKIRVFSLSSDRVLDLVLPKTVPVKVRLITPAGNPIVGAEIRGEASSYFGDVTFGDVTTPGFLYIPMGTDTIAIPSDPYRRSFTDSNGEATFYAMPGQVNLRAGYAVGQTSITKTFTVEGIQQTQNISWNVPSAFTVSGTLRDEDGNPLTGGRITFKPKNNPFLQFNYEVSSYVHVRSDSNGYYSADLVAGDYGVSFGIASDKSNYPRVTGTINSSDLRSPSCWFASGTASCEGYTPLAFTLTQNTALDLVLPRAVPIKVRVVDTSGRPVSGVQLGGEQSEYYGEVVYGELIAPGFSYIPMGTDTIAIPSDPYRRSFTDLNGEATLYALPGQVKLRATYPFGSSTITKTFTLNGDSGTQEISMEIPRKARVTGSLRDVDGVAMTGAQVRFRPIDNPFLKYNYDVSSYVYATVDEQGNYSVDLLEGDYGVSFGVRSNSSNYPFYAGALPVRPDACDGTYDAREGVASYWFGGTCKYGDFYNDAKIRVFSLSSDRVLDLVLPKTVPVKVRLITPAGNPIVGAEIRGEASSYFGDVTFGDVTTPGFLYIPMGTDTIAIPSDPYRRSFTDSNGEATFYAMPGQVNLRAGYAVGQTSITKTFTVEGIQQTQNISWNVPLRDLISTPIPIIYRPDTDKPLLTVSSGVWDEGSSLSYQWLRDGAPITGANTNSYALQVHDLGRNVTVQVRGARPGYIPATKESVSFTANLRNFPSARKPSIVGPHYVGSLLRAVPGVSKQDTSFSFRWFRDGQLIQGEDNSNYVTSSSDIGKGISVEVQATKFEYKKEVAMSAEFLVWASLDSLKFTGKFQVGSTAWVSPKRLLGKYSYTYQWLSNGIPIENAIGRSLTLNASHAGATLSAVVCASAGGVQVQCLTQMASSGVQLGELKAGLMAIRGSKKLGSELSVVLGNWATEANISYAWFRDGVEVTGQTGKNYSTSILDSGKKLSVQVEVSRQGYAPLLVERLLITSP